MGDGGFRAKKAKNDNGIGNFFRNFIWQLRFYKIFYLEHGTYELELYLNGEVVVLSSRYLDFDLI
jgi:hypothetical protein